MIEAGFGFWNQVSTLRTGIRDFNFSFVDIKPLVCCLELTVRRVLLTVGGCVN